MRKIIKLKLENTNRIRTTEDSYCEIYSHDKNNGLFEFEIVNEYLTVENPKAVFKFVGSNKVWQTDGTVVDGRIKVKFDTTLITHDEIVVCWLYLDEEQRSSDAYRSKFKVKLSEIDKVDGYETKERFIKDTLIVDRLDVLTKADLEEAIKDIKTGTISSEGLLTEAKAEETYAKKSEAVDNTNFELVKNRVLALELKTDKDTVYDDSELKGRVSVLEAKEDKDTIYDDTNVRERLTALESKPNIDVNNLVTKDELASKNYLTEHQDTSKFALKSEIPQEYNDTEVKERLTTLENKAPVDLSNLATKQELNEVRNSQPTVDTSNLITRDELAAKNYVTDEVLENKGYLTSHQSLENLVTKEELEEKHFLTDQALNNYALKSELYNDTDLKSRVEVLEQKTDRDTVYDDTPLKERVTALESKAIEGGAYDDKPIRDRLDVLEAKHDNDTIYDDTEVKRRLTELESKPAVDTSVFVTEEKLNSKGYLTQHQSLENVVTKEELESKGYLTLHQDISNLATKEELANTVTKEELNNKHYVTEEELNNKAYLTSHQDLSNYALKSEIPQPYNDSTLNERVTALESKAIEGGAYDDSDLRNRVVALEGKEDKDTKYDDTDLRNRVTNLENKPPIDTSEFVTKDELTNKGYLTTHQSLDHVVTKDELASKNYISDISNLVTKDELASKNYLTEHQPLTEVNNRLDVLEAKQDKDTVYNDSELRQRVTNLENKSNVDLTNYVTSEQLENKHYLTQHQSLEEYAKKSELYNDTDIKQRLTTLESKPNIDTSNFITNEQLEAKHYLTEHQTLTHLATTSDLEALRNVAVSKSELSKKVDATEYNSFKDSVVTKTELTEKGYLTEHQNLDGYAKKSELETLNQTLSLTNGVLSISGGNSVALPASQYEIHGTGMPNGVVEAEIGTTYIDKNKTNGAFKWIKTTNGGNQGWEVLTGDTGWRTLNSTSKLTVEGRTSTIKIRRVNNLVTYNFGGLQWGWFGIVRRGGAGYVEHKSSGERGTKVLPVDGIPSGFRSEASLVGGTYDDKGRPYGVWYLGGVNDSNYIQFTFNDPIPTDRDIRDIRVSAVSYLTSEPWPTQLP